MQTGGPISPSCYLETPGILRQAPQGLRTGAAASFTPSALILFCAQCEVPWFAEEELCTAPDPSECAVSLQLCPTLCDPMDCSPPGSLVYGILEARILEWVATMPFSRGSSHPRDLTQISCVSCIVGGFFPSVTLVRLFHLPVRWSPHL